MRIVESPGTLHRYRQRDWPFQQTLQTPMKDLPRFVDVIFSALPGVQSATAVFEQVVFEPRYGLVPLYARHSLPPKWYGDDLTIAAETAEESRELLEAVLSEWIDFFFVPTPMPFAIYADHDEYATFLSSTRGDLARVTQTLNAGRFRLVDYVRQFQSG
jgi:hypothetical protein